MSDNGTIIFEPAWPLSLLKPGSLNVAGRFLFGHGACGTLVLCLVIGLSTGPQALAANMHPLAPPDTTSPRSTIETFLEEMNSALDAFEAGHRDKAKAHFNRAERCLNLGDEPPAVRNVVAVYSALYLKEILDRIEIPSSEQIPDSAALHNERILIWTIPYTEISIGPVKDESGIGRFLFTPQTLKNLESYYNTVRSLPYKSGCVGAKFEEVVGSAGLLIPKHFVSDLPHWAKKSVLGQSVWQWTGLVLFFTLGMGIIVLTHKWGKRTLQFIDRRFEGNTGEALGGLILPIALVIFAQMGHKFIVYGLHILQAEVYIPVAYFFLSIFCVGTIWVIGALLSRTASLVISVGRFEAGGMHAPLVRFCFDVITVLITIVTALVLGAHLGLPTYSLVAGLGIGGLAVALAGRETLSNLLGTIMILLDQPFKLGDFVVLGEGDRGTVIDIGLRSTRIRTRDGILVSIPNSNVANMRIVNESAPVSEARIHLFVGVAYGSHLKQIEEALFSACEKCEYAAGSPEPEVRLLRFGDSALEFEMLVWIIGPEFRGRAINQLNRGIYDEFAKQNIEIPFPQRDIRIRSSE